MLKLKIGSLRENFHSLFIAVLFSGILAACSEQQQTPRDVVQPSTSAQSKAQPSPQYEIVDPTYLRQRVPDEALAYIRLPNLLSYASSPKGDIFTDALSRKEHQKVIKSLHENMYQTLAVEAKDALNPLMTFWLEHTRTPVELIILSNEYQQPLPRMLMTTTLDFDSQKAFSAFIQGWVGKDETLFLMKDSMLENGSASLASGPISIELHYDTDNKQLRMLAGMGITRDMMQKAFNGLVVKNNQPMFVTEKSIDSSHHGLFVWLNISNILPVAGSVMPPDKYQLLKDSLLSEAKSLAAGMGVSDGKGRLKIIADFNQDALTNKLPGGSMQLKLGASGQPGMVAAVSLISVEQLKLLEEYFLNGFFKAEADNYQSFKNKLQQTSGVSLEEILSAVGPEILFLQDELGEYSALAVRDTRLYSQLLAGLLKNSKMSYSTTEINGITIHSLQMPPYWNVPADSEAINQDNPFIKLLMRAKSHTYWIEEEGFLIFASVPQLLLDRYRHQEKIDVATWLRQSQKQQVKSAIMLASTRIQGSPEKLYYAYLQALLFLSDISAANIDITKLPSAVDVKLPKNGSYGFQLSISDRQVFTELVYEQNPVEFVFGQSLGNVAVVGILAAIAIPAYQDYTVRAKVNESYHQTLPLRRKIESYWLKNGKYPPQREVDQYNFDSITANSIMRIDVIPATGTLVLTMRGHAQLDNKRLTIQPRKTDRGLDWICRGEVPMKYRPRECR